MTWSFPHRRRWFVLAIPVLAAALVIPLYRPAIGQDAVPKAHAAAALEFADEMSRLVQTRKFDELTKYEVPEGGQTAKLSQWKAYYVTEMRKSEELRGQHYDENVAKAQDFVARSKYEEAIDKTVAAYLLSKDQDAFLRLEWVRDLTARVARQASSYEKEGHWLESLQLYTDLHSLYEIDTRYKPDMQRLARRVRLLALYTPKTLYEMRKAMAARQEKDKGDSAATNPVDVDKEPANFPRWQDNVENINAEMARQALDEARSKWVEGTNYEVLLRGGVEALRLFLTTPELAKEFPNLGQEDDKTRFAAALNEALSQIRPDSRMDRGQMNATLEAILAANAKSVQLPESVALMEFTDGAMEKLDPFTAVIWPHEADEFEKSTTGEFGGVGIQINLDQAGLLKVVSPLEETPAIYAGIQAGDIITAIDGKTTTNTTIDQAVRQIMGPPDTKVALTIKREGTAEPLVFNLTRAKIHVSSVKGYKRDPNDLSRWLFMLDSDSRIGYIRVTGFQKDTAAELRSAIEGLKGQGMEGLILDLRFNPGGLLTAAIDMSSAFLERGDRIVSTRGNWGVPWEAKARGDAIVPATLPVVVLVNQYSASASEIFAGAMRDHHRALIVGQRSFGKGSVQNVIDLRNKAAIKLTMSYYYLPNNESLHRRDGEKTWGVEPDIGIDMTRPQIEALIKSRRDADIIARGQQGLDGGSSPATAPAMGPTSGPATQKAVEPLIDTQLDTAVLMLRLQLFQRRV